LRHLVRSALVTLAVVLPVSVSGFAASAFAASACASSNANVLEKWVRSGGLLGFTDQG
jgi:hypothetical protein